MQKIGQTTRFSVKQKVKTIFAMKIHGNKKRKINSIQLLVLITKTTTK